MDKNSKVIGQYKNGNYYVYIMEDGTKIRYTEDDEFKSVFPECIDLCITKSCSMGCQYCYENCLPNGKQWNFSNNEYWLNSLQPYTEIAINGNDWDDIPGIDAFLIQMKNQHVLVNATFHLSQYQKLFNRLKEYQSDNLLWGIGVSINKAYHESVYTCLNYCNNVVIHAVAGIFDKDIFETLTKTTTPKNLKILFLGYKNIGRGQLYNHLYNTEVNDNIKWLSENMDTIMDTFGVVTFDNLALEQLGMRSKASSETWNNQYMGNDGQFTMYIDAVDEEFAMNSMAPKEKRHKYNLVDNKYADINTFFKIIKQDAINEHENEILKDIEL